MGVEVEEGAGLVRRAAAGILAARPVYAEMIGFYGDLFVAQEEIRPRVRIEPVRLSPEMARIKRRDHFPLIQTEEMRFDPEAGRSLFEEVCRIAVDRRTELSAPAQTLCKRSADASALFQGFLAEDENRIQQAAADFGVEAAALSFFLYHSLRPSLCRCEQDLTGFVVDEASWEKGYCPVCGSQPALAQLDAEGRRFLFCSFCWHRWPAPRTACPFCGNGDPGRLAYLYSDEEPEHRLDLCDGCRKYLKTVDARNLSRPFYPPLEQVATLHLDLKAAESGYESLLPSHRPA
jgi:FdhE protein